MHEVVDQCSVVQHRIAVYTTLISFSLPGGNLEWPHELWTHCLHWNTNTIHDKSFILNTRGGCYQSLKRISDSLSLLTALAHTHLWWEGPSSLFIHNRALWGGPKHPPTSLHPNIITPSSSSSSFSHLCCWREEWFKIAKKKISHHLKSHRRQPHSSSGPDMLSLNSRCEKLSFPVFSVHWWLDS